MKRGKGRTDPQKLVVIAELDYLSVNPIFV